MSYFEALKKHLLYPAVHVNLPDLAFTLSERRTEHFFRGFIVTNTTALGARALITGKKSVEGPRIGYIFTGQGAQWQEMGKLLVQCFPIASKLLQSMDAILQKSVCPPGCLCSVSLQANSL